MCSAFLCVVILFTPHTREKSSFIYPSQREEDNGFHPRPSLFMINNSLNVGSLWERVAPTDLEEPGPPGATLRGSQAPETQYPKIPSRGSTTLNPENLCLEGDHVRSSSPFVGKETATAALSSRYCLRETYHRQSRVYCKTRKESAFSMKMCFDIGVFPNSERSVVIHFSTPTILLVVQGSEPFDSS